MSHYKIAERYIVKCKFNSISYYVLHLRTNVRSLKKFNDNLL
jgi:hypothetical protein